MIYINGRFLGQRVTGVQRFAREALFALDGLLESESARAPGPFIVVAPRGVERVKLRCIPVRHVGPLSGHAWEQLTLPASIGTSPLLSFGPTGPIGKRNQIVTIHDAAVRVVPESYGVAFRSLYSVMLPILVRRAWRVATVSDFSRRELIGHFGAPDEKVIVVGEGCEHMVRMSAEPAVLEKNGLTPGRYFLAVSSLTANKNLGVVARAFQALRLSGVHLALAGSVDERLFAEVSRPEGPAVRRLGYVTDGELRALYENAAAFIFPSFYEGFGLPPIEAMAMGCPVIASNAAAIPEVCGDAPLYFDPRDEAALANLMRRVVEDEGERRAMIHRGRETIRRHGWRATAKAYLALARHWTERRCPSDKGRDGTGPDSLNTFT